MKQSCPEQILRATRNQTPTPDCPKNALAWARLCLLSIIVGACLTFFIFNVQLKQTNDRVKDGSAKFLFHNSILNSWARHGEHSTNSPWHWKDDAIKQFRCPKNNTEAKKQLLVKPQQLDHIIVDDVNKLLFCYVPKVACTNWRKSMVIL